VSVKPPPSRLSRFVGLDRVVASLGIEELDVDAIDIADALWLATHLPAPKAPDENARGHDAGGASSNPAKTNTDESSPSLYDASRPRADTSFVSEQQAEGPVRHLYPRSAAASAAESGRTIVLPDATALPDKLALGRALRPLRRRVDGAKRNVLDEALTAHRIATLRLVWPDAPVIPELRFGRVRWLDAVLLVDRSQTMALWRRTTEEWEVLLHRLGAFRNVRVWHLLPGDEGKPPKLVSPAGTSDNATWITRSEAELAEARSRRVLIVATDCMGPLWQSAETGRWLERHANGGPVAILNVLPQHHWHRTTLGRLEPFVVRANASGGLAPRLDTARIPFDDEEAGGAVATDDATDPPPAVPVVPIDAAALSSWAKMLVGHPSGSATGYSFASVTQRPSPAKPASAADAPAASDVVDRFLRTSTAPARKLAAHLAALPLMMPVVRIARSVFVPEARDEHLVEVLWSGLVVQVVPDLWKAEPEEVVYDFRPGVRELLLKSLGETTIANVVRRVGAFVASRRADGFNFAAVLDEGDAPASEAARPFASVSTALASTIGRARKRPPITGTLSATLDAVTLMASARVRNALLDEGDRSKLAQLFQGLLGESPHGRLARLMPDAESLPKVGRLDGTSAPFERWLDRCDAVQLLAILGLIPGNSLAVLVADRIRATAQLGILENGAWILVDGTEGLSVPTDQQRIAEYLGVELARAGFSLITFGARGVAHIVARAFFRVLERCGYTSGIHRLLNVVPKGSRADFSRGRTVSPGPNESLVSAAMRRADAVFAVGVSQRDVIEEHARGKPVRMLASGASDDVETVREEVALVRRSLGLNQPASHPTLAALAELALDERDLNQYNLRLDELGRALPAKSRHDEIEGEKARALLTHPRCASRRLVGHHLIAKADRASIVASLQAEHHTIRNSWETRTLWFGLEAVESLRALTMNEADRAIAATCACLDADLDANPEADAARSCRRRLAALFRRDKVFARARTLATRAREYESLRETLPTGSERTAKMQRIVDEIRGMAERPVAREAEAWFASGRPGERMVGFSLFLGSPEKEAFEHVGGAIDGMRTRFEQFQALVLADAILDLLDEEQRARLGAAIAKARESGSIDPSDPSRWVLSVQLLRRLERVDAAPAVAPPVLRIERGHIVDEVPAAWREILDRKREIIRRAAEATCFVTSLDGRGIVREGTAFIVGHGVVLTASFLLPPELLTQGESRYVPIRKPVRVHLQLGDRPLDVSLEDHRATEVLYVDVEKRIALLRVPSVAAMERQPLALATSVAHKDEHVALLGYVGGAKRVMPGRLVDVGEDGTVRCDHARNASAVGGPIVSLARESAAAAAVLLGDHPSDGTAAHGSWALLPAAILEQLAKPTPFAAGYAPTEPMIVRHRRPLAFIIANDWENLEAPWQPLNEPDVRERLRPLIASIGRIELPDHPTFPYAGTGFVVGPDLVMTARHVADTFAAGVGIKGVRFQSGAKAAIDFARERDTSEDDRGAVSAVREIVMIHPYWDMAILRVDHLPPNRLPLRLSVRPPEDLVDAAIVVVGYPSRDDRKDLAVQDGLLRGIGGVKRLQPGRVLEPREIQSRANTVRALRHDAFTLGGNGGSPIIDITTGEVLGLHFASRDPEGGFALPMSELARDQRVVELGLSFAARIPFGDTTDAAWAETDAERPSVPYVEAGSDDDEQVAPALGERGGYDSAFLGREIIVPLPKVVRGADDVLRFDVYGRTSSVLRYEHFSVVMSKSRRLCFFSAANIDGARAVKLRLEQRFDLDPRIPRRHQILTYGPKGWIRAHMTRRSGVLWGTVDEAQRANEDTMKAPNVAPISEQAASGVWLSLEEHALERADRRRMCVFTGPVFTDADPVLEDIEIPLHYWKVIVLLHEGRLSATGYVLSQARSFGGGNEDRQAEHGTAQVTIRRIEELAGLSFGPLSKFDPLADE
jgi:endonuclease G, mitochondrial